MRGVTTFGSMFRGPVGVQDSSFRHRVTTLLFVHQTHLAPSFRDLLFRHKSNLGYRGIKIETVDILRKILLSKTIE